MVAALRAVTRIGCTAHMLNTVLHTTLENLLKMISLMKNCPLSSSLPRLLWLTLSRQTSKVTGRKHWKHPWTRWNSLHTVLESIYSQYEQVSALLEERREEHRLTDLSRESLSDMVTFLAQFKDATMALEASKTLTLHLTIVLMEHPRSDFLGATSYHWQHGTLFAEEKSLKILNITLELHLLHKMAASQTEKPEAAAGPVMTVHGRAWHLAQGRSNCNNGKNCN